jgi:hypothetical protein
MAGILWASWFRQIKWDIAWVFCASRRALRRASGRSYVISRHLRRFASRNAWRISKFECARISFRRLRPGCAKIPCEMRRESRSSSKFDAGFSRYQEDSQKSSRFGGIFYTLRWYVKFLSYFLQVICEVTWLLWLFMWKTDASSVFISKSRNRRVHLAWNA